MDRDVAVTVNIQTTLINPDELNNDMQSNQPNQPNGCPSPPSPRKHNKGKRHERAQGGRAAPRRAAPCGGGSHLDDRERCGTEHSVLVAVAVGELGPRD